MKEQKNRNNTVSKGLPIKRVFKMRYLTNEEMKLEYKGKFQTKKRNKYKKPKPWEDHYVKKLNSWKKLWTKRSGKR